MAFASLDSDDQGEHSEPLAEINMVPLIDVMLVLLIIFMVTAPLLTHAVKLDLPKAASTANPAQPDKVELSIDGEGRLFWNGQPTTSGALDERLAAAAARQPQPELHLRADRTTRYEKIAQVMSAAAGQGLSRVGFVTDPTPAR